MKTQPYLVRRLQRHNKRIKLLISKRAPGLRMQSIALPVKVFNPVARRQPAYLPQVEHRVPGPALPVEP